MESSVNCSDNNEISKSIISGPKLKLILIIFYKFHGNSRIYLHLHYNEFETIDTR